MSRTTRLRVLPLDKEFFKTIYRKEIVERKFATSHGDGPSGHHSLPRMFRNLINRQRRAKDKQALCKVLNNDECRFEFATWNCKDAKVWNWF